MKHWPAILVGTLVFWRMGEHSLNALWMSRWFILLAMLGIGLSWRVRKVSLPLYIVTLWVGFCGIRSVFWYEFFKKEPMEIKLALQVAGAQGLITFALILAFFLTVKVKHGKSLEQAIGLCGWLTSLHVIVWYLLGVDVSAPTGLPMFDNPSMAASFIAITLFILDRDVDLRFNGAAFLRVVFWVTGIVAIVLTRSTTPLLALGAGLVTLLVLNRFRWQYLIPLLGLPSLAYLYSDNLLSDSGRFHLWGMMYRWWVDQGWVRVAFGTGLGSMRFYIPQEQALVDGMTTGFFFWLHNDWLQIAMEQGVVGFLCAIGLGAAVLWKARHTPHLAASLVAFGVTMCTNYPLHWPVHAFLGAILVHQALIADMSFGSFKLRD